MAIKGSLKEASLPDVLQLLALGKKTGCLAVADRQNFGYIYFDEGRICYASHRQPARPHRRPPGQERADHQRSSSTKAFALQEVAPRTASWVTS